MEEKLCAYCGNSFEPKTHNHKYDSIECKRDAERAAKRKAYTADVASAVASIYLNDDVDEEDVIDFLRKENTRLDRAFLKLKTASTVTEQNFMDAIRDGLQEFQLPDIASPKVTRKKNQEELVAVACVSDQQLAKVTPSYDTQVCEERMMQYQQAIIDKIDFFRSDYTINNLRLWMLGDIIEGVGIFLGQQFLTDGGLYRQITVDGPRIFSRFIKGLLEHVDNIDVVCVIGNHGRMPGKDLFDPETNGDRMLYKILEHIFAENDRVHFHIPDGKGEKNWFTVDKIGNYSSLLLHGDQFRSFNPIAMQKKILAWRAGGIKEAFQDVTMGHFHQATKFTVGNIIVRVNGTTESNNTWAQEELGHMGDPCQHLMFVNPKGGYVDAEYDIYL